MYVYVIAENPSGPVKVGKADQPTTRLRSLQTGTPQPLRVWFKQFVGSAAGVVETFTKRELGSYRVEGGGSEWFDVPVWLARWSLQRAQAVVSLEATPHLSVSECRDVLFEVNLCPAEYHAYQEQEDFEDELRLKHLKWIDALALLVKPRPKIYLESIRFGDFLKSFEYGKALNKYVLQKGIAFQWPERVEAYISLTETLRAHPHCIGPCFWMIRLMWTESRILTDMETRRLRDIWNLYAQAVSKIWKRGPQALTHGIDDTVSGVWIYTEVDWPKYTGCIIFRGKSFEAIMLLPNEVETGDGNFNLKPIPPHARLSGYIYPIFDRGFELAPFDESIHAARTRMIDELSMFLQNEKHQFPQAREYDGSFETACVMQYKGGPYFEFLDDEQSIDDTNTYL